MISLRIRSQEIEWQLAVHNGRPWARHAKVCLERLMRLEVALGSFSAMTSPQLAVCAMSVYKASAKLAKAMDACDRARERHYATFSL